MQDQLDPGTSIVSLRRRVHRTADLLFGRGLSPTLAHIEAKVKGPRQIVIWLLEEWALRQRSGGEAAMHSRLQLSRVPQTPELRRGHLAKMAKKAVRERQTAAVVQAIEAQNRARAEAQQEILRARARLVSLRRSPADDPEARRVSIAKLERRLAALEEQLRGFEAAAREKQYSPQTTDSECAKACV